MTSLGLLEVLNRLNENLSFSGHFLKRQGLKGKVSFLGKFQVFSFLGIIFVWEIAVRLTCGVQWSVYYSVDEAYELVEQRGM